MSVGTALPVRRLQILFLYALTLVPLIVFGAMKAMESNANSPIDWVPATFPPRAVYDRFSERFGPGDAVVLSWDGCTLAEERLDRLTKTLRTSKHFQDEDGQSLFERVASGRELYLKLTTGPHPIQPEAAINRLSGIFIGPDEETTCVIVTFTSTAMGDRARIVGLIETATSQICKVERDELHLAGPVMDGLSVDQAGQASLDRLAIPSAIIVLIVACLSLWNWRVGVMVFGISLYCQGATLALVFFGGETMSALLIVLPPLIQVLAVAGGIHLVNYYFESLPTNSLSEAPWQAVRLGWLPCLLSAGTTALGIGSLTTSELSPIRSFGVFGAVGVVITAGLLLTILPSLLLAWPPVRKNGALRSPLPQQGNSHTSPGWTRLAGIVKRGALLIVAGTLLIMFATGLGVRQLKTSVRIETLFHEDSRILADYRWLEEHIGALVPIEVVITYERSSAVPHFERLQRLREIQAELHQVDHVDGTFSALNMLPVLSELNRMPSQMREQATGQILRESRRSLLDAGFVATSKVGEHWRLTAYVSSLADIDYGHFLNDVRSAVDPLLTNSDGSLQDATVSIEYTGIMPLVAEIQRQLLSDLFKSFVGACILIALVMTVTLGSISAGLLAMIPNVFPMILLFGLLGWVGVPLDIGTVMTASVALGIAVDDTLHFLTFYQRGLAESETRQGAVLIAYRHCGRAMIQTSVTCGTGLLVFALADFVPTSRFAWMTSSLLASALAGDLLLLPALLLSPLGKSFGTPQGVPASTPARESFEAESVESEQTASA